MNHANEVRDYISSRIPIIEIGPLLDGTAATATTATTAKRYAVAAEIGKACRESGFFYITGHGVGEKLQQRLEHLSRQFFAQPLETKMAIRMARGGKAWRGYFPVGGELTSGQPDLKEGVYFGAELDEDHPMARAGVPLHGPNLFPASIPEFRRTVLEYLNGMTALGHALMRGIALSLGLAESYFAERYTGDPLILFRIFNYPAQPSTANSSGGWGVGEHTDYGLLTILKQDDAGGLQVKSQSQWIEAHPIPGSFICNIGDMLDRLTGGLYRSTPHRVRNLSGRDRLSFPFFFDPNFNAEVEPLPSNATTVDNRDERWDQASVHEFRGTYGDYLLDKVSKVFPELRREV
jgi:isopenicillin N synthase-like dioxygenase